MNRWLLMLLLTLQAATVAAQSGLYVGEAEVADQSAAERQRALPETLAQVLSKHTGLRDVRSDPAVRSQLAAAGDMLLTYSYRTVFEPGPDGTEIPRLRLVAQYLPEPVDDLVRRLPLQRWPTPRDPVQLWVVVDDGLGRRVQPEEMTAALERLQRTAADRGLPLTLGASGEDEAAQAQLLWGGFTESLRETGTTDDILIAAARQDGPLWRVQWVLDVGAGQPQQRLAVTDANLLAALEEGLQQNIDALVATSAISTQDSGEWVEIMTIGGLHDAAAWRRTAAYLRGLDAVDELRLLSAEPGRVTVELRLNASPEYLAGAVQRDGVLAPGRQGADLTLLP